jgi:hypothetical protein
MTYTPELIEALNTGLLENGSELEVEIRGCSIEAVERIVTEVKKMIVDEKEAELHFVNAALVNIFFPSLLLENKDAIKMLKLYPHL